MANFDAQRMLDDWQIAWSSAENKDTEMVLALLAEDCVFEDVTFGVIVRGKEELRSFVNGPYGLSYERKAVVAATVMQVPDFSGEPPGTRTQGPRLRSSNHWFLAKLAFATVSPLFFRNSNSLSSLICL